MEKVALVKELLIPVFGTSWRGSCSKIESTEALINWILGYPQTATKLSTTEHEIEFVKAVRSIFDEKLFLKLPNQFRVKFLQEILKFLRQGPYTIVRFRCLAERHKLFKEQNILEKSFIVTLLNLLNTLIKNSSILENETEKESDTTTCIEMLELIGLLGVGGVSVRELKSMLRLIGDGPHWQRVLKGDQDQDKERDSHILAKLRHPILKSIVTMTSFEDAQHKARPTSLWSLGGKGSGLKLQSCSWPLGSEYSFSSWIRVQTAPRNGEKAFLWDFTTEAGAGVSIYLKGSKTSNNGSQLFVRCADLSENSTDAIEEHAVPDFEIRNEIWYHIAFRHGSKGSSSSGARSGLNWLGVSKLFGKDEMSVLVDGDVIFETELSVPRTLKSKGSFINPTIGKDFNGQMGDVYVFKEAVTPTLLIKLMDASNGSSRYATTGPALPPDMDPSFDSGRRLLSDRLLAVFSPSRVRTSSGVSSDLTALEVHGSFHALVIGNTFAWSFKGADPKDVIGSLGGLRCLFPLLAPLLTASSPLKDVATKPNGSTSTPNGSMGTNGSQSDEGSLRGSEPTSPKLEDEEEDEEEDYDTDDDDDDDEVLRVVGNETEVLMTCDMGENSTDLRNSTASLDHSNSKTKHRKKKRSNKKGKRTHSVDDMDDIQGDELVVNNEVALLLRIFARFLKDHEANQREMLRIGGVNLLCWALTRAAEKGYLRRCCDKEVGRSLLELSSACREHPQLGRQVDTSVLFDLRIWSKSSLMMQLSVLPVLVSVLRSDPSHFVPRVPLAPLLDALRHAYCRAGLTESMNEKRGPPIKDFLDVFGSTDKAVAESARRISFFYRQKDSTSSYDPIATEYHLRAVVLTILRIVLETLTKAEIPVSINENAPKTSDDMQSEVDRTYNLIGAGWSTVSAAIYVQSIDPLESDTFTRFMMGGHQNHQPVAEPTGRMGGRVSATSSPLDLGFSTHNDLTATGGNARNSIASLRKVKNSSRLSSDMGLILQLLAECPNRCCVHALGTVLLDLLRDVKLPSRFVEAIASHFDNSWEVATTFMLSAVAEHSSESEELCSLGIRLVGALLRRTALDESGKGRRTFMGSSMGRLVGFQRRAGSEPVISQRTSVPLTRQSTGLESRERSSTSSDLDMELSTTMALAADNEGRTIEDEKNSENYVAMNIWGQDGGGHILYRLLRKRLMTKGRISSEVYGALLELTHLSDTLVANMTTVYANQVKASLSDKIRNASDEDPFVLSDYPQLESSLFLAPPCKHLAKKITTLFQIPRVRNTSALSTLLMIIPSLPDSQQKRIWDDLSILIGKSCNLKMLLVGDNELLTLQWTLSLFELLKRCIRKPGDSEDDDDDDMSSEPNVRHGGGVKFALDDQPEDETDDIADLPQAQDGRKNDWYELTSNRLGDLVAWSLWVGSRSNRSVLATVFSLAQVPSRDENTKAATLRAILSRALTTVKERSFLANKANSTWVLEAIHDKSPRWEKLTELLFVTAACCVQQTYVSVLASRSVTDAAQGWVRPTDKRMAHMDLAAATMHPLEGSRESVFMGGTVVGESYLSPDGVFASMPPLLSIDETQSAADTMLALQVLELFDMLVWPSSMQGHKCLDLLTNSNKTPAGPPGRFTHQPPMLMTLLQLSLICLAGIHPSDPIAFENALRVRKLIQWLLQQPISTKTRPPKSPLESTGSLDGSGGTAGEWLILCVVHIHAALTQVQHLIFSEEGYESLRDQGTAEALIRLKQAACTAEQLMKVLSLVVSANDETLKSTFSTGPGDNRFSEVMLSSHTDSGRKASNSTNLEGVRKAMNWLKTSPWLLSPVASLQSVHAIVKRVGHEETALADGLSQCASPPPNLEELWGSASDLEGEAEKRAWIGKKKLVRAETKARKQWKKQRAAIHRSQAASWARTLTMSRRAAWSPWVEAVGTRGGDSEGKMAAAVWKLSNHRDAFGRRMLLQRNFTYGDHDDSSYNSHRHPKQAVDPDIALASEAASLLKKVGRPTMGPQEGDLLRRKMADEDSDDDNDDDSDSEDETSAASKKNGSAKSPLRAPAPKGLVQDLKSTVQLVVLGVTVPGTLVLTEFHAVFAHDPVQLEELKQKKSQGTIPPYLIAAPLTWRLDKLVEIHNRRFNLEPCAVELYFADGQDVFIAFDAKLDGRRQFWKALQQRSVRGSVMLLRHVPKSRKPHKVLIAAKLTDAWRTRRITNFEYLLRLNVIAGRSFNDLSQYPVFPWIIADYTSDTLDLDDITNSKGQFRDLTKPVGALTEDRLKLFLERYHDLEYDDDMEAFMYGTHYSSAGIVLHFLLRQEPFTSLAIDFQGGHFDCPDRLFFDVAESWKGCTSSMSDVKEVIPEWYCFPEAFLNRNHWDLGELQVGPQVFDVKLPPWAKGDSDTQRAFEFVRLNRKALESEYVSMNLHHWIDLIFGENQRDINKCNVFHPMTYENAVDMEAIEDIVQREAAVAQIRHFGQTPTQLVKKAHPKRLPVNECMRPLCSSHEMIENMKFWAIPKHARPSDSKGHGSVQALIIVGDRLVTIYGDLTVNIVRWSNMPDGSGLPFTLTNRTTKILPEKATAKSPYTLSTSDARRPSQNGSKQASHENPIFGSFGICTSSTGPGANGTTVGDTRLLSCGYWDGALKCHALESSSMRLQASTSGGHCGDVNVLQVGSDGQTVVTGGADATCRVWIVDNAGMASALTAEDPLDTNPYIDSTNHANSTEQQGGMSAAANDLGLLSSQEESEGKTREASDDKADVEGDDSQQEGGVERLLRCVHILWGHEAPVTAVALSSTLDLVVTGAENGHVLVHRVQAGDHVRNLVDATTPNIAQYGPISMITISAALCYVVVHCRESMSLRVFSINGDLLSETKTTQALNAMVVSNVGDLLIVGGDGGVLEIYSIHDLQLLDTKSFQVPKISKRPSNTVEDSVPSAITVLSFGKDYQYLFVGTESGEVWICTDPRIRLEMLDIAINRTFAGMI